MLAPTPIAAQVNLQKAIDRYIEKVREDADEYKEARKIIYGDVDGDGTKDAVVQYTLEAQAAEILGDKASSSFSIKRAFTKCRRTKRLAENSFARSIC